MITPAGGDAVNLYELEIEVKEELIAVEASPLEDADGVPTAEWRMDPYAPLYEASLRALLGAIEAMEDASRGGNQYRQAGTTPEA